MPHILQDKTNAFSGSNAAPQHFQNEVTTFLNSSLSDGSTEAQVHFLDFAIYRSDPPQLLAVRLCEK
jgi:hypothetical protein